MCTDLRTAAQTGRLRQEAMGAHALKELAIAVGQASSPLERQRRLNRLILAMQKSGKIWRGAGAIDREGYEEALQKTWLYLCKNIDSYDPSRASVITWFNKYLRFRIKDHNIEQWNEARQRISIRPAGPGMEEDNPIDRLPARQDVPPILDEVYSWVASEPHLLTLHLRNQPHVNCRLLLNRRLPAEIPWKDISKEVNVAVPTLSNLYQNKCLPCLLAFGRDRGLIPIPDFPVP